jgi:hypothetical protein
MVHQLRDARDELEERLRNVERTRVDAPSLNPALRDSRRGLAPVRPQRSARRPVDLEARSAAEDTISLRSSVTGSPMRRRLGSLTDRSERTETHSIRSASRPYGTWQRNDSLSEAQDSTDTHIPQYRVTEGDNMILQSRSLPRRINGDANLSPVRPGPRSANRNDRERTPSFESSFPNVDLLTETPLMKTQLPKPRFGSRSTLSSDPPPFPRASSRSSSSVVSGGGGKSHKRSFSAGSSSTEFAFAEHLPPQSGWLPTGSVGDFALGLAENDQKFLDDLEGGEDNTIHA